MLSSLAQKVIRRLRDYGIRFIPDNEGHIIILQGGNKDTLLKLRKFLSEDIDLLNEMLSNFGGNWRCQPGNIDSKLEAEEYSRIIMPLSEIDCEKQEWWRMMQIKRKASGLPCDFHNTWEQYNDFPAELDPDSKAGFSWTCPTGEHLGYSGGEFTNREAWIMLRRI